MSDRYTEGWLAAIEAAAVKCDAVAALLSEASTRYRRAGDEAAMYRANTAYRSVCDLGAAIRALQPPGTGEGER